MVFCDVYIYQHSEVPKVVNGFSCAFCYGRSRAGHYLLLWVIMCFLVGLIYMSDDKSVLCFAQSCAQRMLHTFQHDG